MANTVYRTGQALKDYLLLMATLESLEPQEIAALLPKCKKGDQKALRELVENFLPKVVLWVAPRRGEGFSFQELIALGNSAVIECLHGYKGEAARLEDKVCETVQDALDTALKMQA